MREYMSPTPVTIDCHASVAEARERMAAGGLRHLPVTDRGRLVGLVSERDLHRLTARKGRVDEEQLAVAQAMAPEPYTVDADDPLARVAHEMALRHIGSAVVLDRGLVVGIFTSTDALATLAALIAGAEA